MTTYASPIGSSLKRVDGPGKISGLEKYAADYYPDNFLWAGAKRSDHPHALIKEIDISPVRNLPGIFAVLTHEDIKGANRVGVPEMDQPVLADRKVRYKGDPVVLVLAENKTVLQEAIDKIVIKYEPLPAVFDPEAALAENAPLLHENRNDKNLLLGGRVVRGNSIAAMSECDAVAEADFQLPWQEHAYLETEAGVARVDEEGILAIIASTQTPWRDRNELAYALGWPLDKIRVIAPYLGGGFGGKDGITVQGLLGLAALHSGGRPVKMWNSREESFLSSTKRHPGRVHYELGCKKDGTLYAMNCRIVLDTGAYASLGGPVLALAMEHAAGVYRIPHALIEGFSVYTNNPVGGAFRGFGAPQVLAGLEQMMDILADKIAWDPLAFRLKNAVMRGDETGAGVWMSNSTAIIPCLEKLQEHPLWTSRQAWVSQAPPFKLRGVGIAAGLQGTGYGPMVADIANAKIELLPDGRFRIYSGVADMGQGNNPTNVQIAAEVLGQTADCFELIQPDTLQTLPSGSSAASRTTYSYGNALKAAALQLKERILTRACNMGMGLYAEDFLLSSGRLNHLPSGREIPLGLVAASMRPEERVSIYSYTAPVNRYPDKINPDIRAAGFPHRVFAFACHLARVQIDELTGEVEISDYLAATDAGKVLNPQLYEQQVQGGAVQGMGYALWEDFKLDRGELMTRNLATYILPTSMDVPDILSIAVESVEESGPFGMKGIGEIVINLALPAIANGIARAVGQHIFKSPLTAEQLLLILEKRAAE
ncbi:xanthine dehydrogenase family protein molybdopterin-binding subunit [Syntrophomonas wolfei]|jgi:CO/xanthine dehydrogenase Mo-binding subunit|uniref:xanthine dehydrogenase family protein molybdopterin-binding subunit n=1 Tax=Syntrophomonas wolfei TaxID=863 RepID=UPI00077463FB|nr:xanthine dehydrogenase family protein molybdopterin-binding subunit [Syntrophomonas wolfei]